MKIIFNADDFGLTKGVTDGIVKTCKNGVVRSTTALCNMPDIEYAAEAAKQCPDLGIGVHLTLTVGKALTENRTLTGEDGKFLPKKELSQKIMDDQEIYAEWKAQIERFFQVFGQRPTHLDSHHHVHVMSDGMKRIARSLAEEYALPVRFFSSFQCLIDFYKEEPSLELLMGIVEEHRGQDIEIMCHPGYCDEELCRVSSLNTRRQRELEVLVSDDLKRYLEDNRIVLSKYMRAV